MKLILVRHGESTWNKENRFCGWTDVDLTETGIMEAKSAGKVLKDLGYSFDVCYTSILKRAIHTEEIILNEMELDIPVIKSWKLNERHYGALQGLNKSETALKYGEEQVHIWRRSFDVKPPLLDETDERNPKNQELFKDINEELPLGESLLDTIERVIPYYNEYILKDIKEGKRVIIVAHGNSLRALVKYLENISDEEIAGLNIPTGVPLMYELDNTYKVINKEYLGNKEEIENKINKVINQGKKN